MSKSLKRVKAALQVAGLEAEIVETASETRTAQQAADVVGCEVDQIAKSILFRGEEDGLAILFVTAGGKQVCAERASQLAQQPLGRADAAFVRKQTGFAIGGVSPIGHLTAPTAFFDPRLLEFEMVWAAAGTPRHVFGVAPAKLLDVSGAKQAAFTLPRDM